MSDTDTTTTTPPKFWEGKSIPLKTLLVHIGEASGAALKLQEESRGKSKTKPKFYYYCEGKAQALTELYRDVCGMADGDDSDQVKELKIALADAIRRPMGVVPDSAIKFVTAEDMDRAELRRLALPKPPVG